MPVRLFVMGRNTWRDEPSWPPADVVTQRHFLRADGSLTADSPSAAESETEFVYDPADPVPTLGGQTVMRPFFASGPMDQTRIESRNDVCVFTSEPLSEELEVTGRVRVVLHAESSAPSTDWVARLCDVHPDGRSFNLCDGIVRVAGQAGELARHEIDLWSTANVFLPGHRVRIDVTSSSFPRWDRNLNTGDQRAPQYQSCAPTHPPRQRASVVRRAGANLTARLAGKVCIVTGAASGIGAASAALFAAEGAAVVAADLDGTPYRVDVADETETLALAAAVVAEHGRIDVLFNNAGIAGVGDVEETSLELWEQVMRVNVRGVFLMSRAVVPTMIAQRSGSIVNMSSAIAGPGLARRVSYAASKGAVLALTKSMQVDLAPHGVRVNALMPGTIMTPFVERYLAESYADPEEGRRSIRSRQLGGELGTPEDVAQAALYLASDESRFVLGSGLVVDGGLSAGKA